MSLNIDKTKLIQFKTKHKSVSDIIINNQNQVIKEISYRYTKFLGLQIDQNLD